MESCKHKILENNTTTPTSSTSMSSPLVYETEIIKLNKDTILLETIFAI